MLRTSAKRVLRRSSVLRMPVLAPTMVLRVPAARSIHSMTSVRPGLPKTMRLPSIGLVRLESTSVKVPEMAESITEGTLSSWAKSVGDYIAQDELLATVETDKIDVEINSPVGGTITELLFQPDDTVEVGQEIAKIEPGAAPEGAAAPAAKEKSPTEEAAPAKEAAAPAPTPAATPAAAPAAKSAPAPAPTPAAPAAASKPSAPAPAKASSSKSPTEPRQTSPFGQYSRNEEHVKMNRMRKRIAERLKEAQNTAASLTTFNEIDMSSLLQMRKQYKDEFIKKTGIKFGFMGPFSKACTLAAKDIPAVNGSIEGEDMVYRDYMDISIAVATPKGLVTPVIRNAESLSVLDIEAEIVRLSHKARDGKLQLEDLAGGTFTISNGGVFGSLFGTPIINSPQTAVLGLHGVKERPVSVNGKIESHPMMYVALTYDHRMLDGREAVTFLRTVKELIEDPRKMILM